MPSAKLLSAFAMLAVLSGCASITGKKSAAAADPQEIEAANARAAALEVEIARLKSENARLAGRLSDLQRERDKLAALDADAGDGEAAPVGGAPIRLSDGPAIADALSQPLADAVVDDAAAPALAQTDVPVETAPRLVQPTFASNETVFENEAEGEIETSSILFGVHLASYRKTAEAREGWRKLQRENPDELGLLEPRVEAVTLPEKGVFLRLIGGGFSSNDKAQALCAKLKVKGRFCSVVAFEGARLSLADAARR